MSCRGNFCRVSEVDRMGQERPRSQNFHLVVWPIFAVALLVILQAGGVNLLQILTHTPLYPVGPSAFGGDFSAFGWGGNQLFKESCPWNDRATHPPFFKQVLSFSTVTPHGDGIVRFFWGNVICVPICVALVSYLFLPARRLSAIAAIVCAGLLSYPVLMLLDRGNIDAWVILFMVGGLFGLSRNRYAMAGTLITFAFASKVYPIVLLAPLFLQFQVRTLLWSLLASVVVYLLAPDAWWCYVSETLLARMRIGAGSENGSLMSTISWIRNRAFNDPETLSTYYFTAVSVIVLNLLLDLLSNWRRLEPRDRAAWLLLYIPLMLAFPQTVYHYCLWAMLLLPFAYAHLLSTSNSLSLRALVLVCCVGVALSQFPAVSLDAIHQKVSGVYQAGGQRIPGYGALLVLVAHIPLKLMWLLQMPARVKSGRAQDSSSNATPSVA